MLSRYLRASGKGSLLPQTRKVEKIIKKVINFLEGTEPSSKQSADTQSSVMNNPFQFPPDKLEKSDIAKTPMDELMPEPPNK